MCSINKIMFGEVNTADCLDVNMENLELSSRREHGINYDPTGDCVGERISL